MPVLDIHLFISGCFFYRASNSGADDAFDEEFFETRNVHQIPGADGKKSRSLARDITNIVHSSYIPGSSQFSPILKTD